MLDLTPVAAEIFLISAICVVLIVDVFLKKEQRLVTFYLAILSLIGAAVCSVYFGVDETTIVLNGAFIGDQAGNVLKLFSYLVIAVVFLSAQCGVIQRRIFCS